MPPASARAISSGPKESGTFFGAAAGGDRAEEDHHRQQHQHQPDRVGVEDQLDRVADQGQLDDRAARWRRRCRARGRRAARRRSPPPARPGPARRRPARGRRGSRCSAAASRQHLRQRAAADDPAALQPQHPVAEPARLLGVVADEDDRDLELAPQLAPASPRSRRGRRGRGPRSARRAAGRAGRWASARASIARCCSPTESLATSRSAKAGSRPARREAARSASSSSPASSAA